MRTMFSMGFKGSVEAWRLGQSDPALVSAYKGGKAKLAAVRAWMPQADALVASAASDDTSSGQAVIRLKELERTVSMDEAAVDFIMGRLEAGESLDLGQANDVREWVSQVEEMGRIAQSLGMGSGAQPTPITGTQVRGPNGTWYTAPGSPGAPAAPAAPGASGITNQQLLVGAGVTAALGIVLYAIWG